MNRDKLLEIIRNLKSPRILVVGDFMLDRYISGNVERINPESPVPVLEALKSDTRIGGAGNVAEAITARRRIPILMLTAYSDRELVERATKLAVFAYLVKPVKEADLGLAIELAMARFEEWRTLEREAANLKEALATREVVGRAKEVLMQRDGLTEHEAFLSIQRRSRNSRRTMREVAEAILGVGHG